MIRPSLRFVPTSLALALAGVVPLCLHAAPAATDAGSGSGPDHPAPAYDPIADKPAVEAPAASSGPAQPPAPTVPATPSPPARVRATDEIHGLLNLGSALTDRADYEAAEIAFRQVMNAPEVAPEDLKTALLGLARMHRRQGALTKAVAIYERYLKDYTGDERSPDVLLDLGRTLRALGIHKLAINRFYSVLNSTLKLTGESFAHYQLVAKTAQFEIAQTHFEAGNFAEAGKYFARLRLLDLSPEDRGHASFMSARALRLQGDRASAVTMLRNFIEQCPRDENIPEARYLLAVTLRELKQPQEALTATLDLLRVEKSQVAADPKRWAYWQRRTGNQLANDFFEAGDTLNAHTIYTGLTALSAEPAWRLPLVYQVALCEERLGHLDLARTSYRTVVDAAGATPPAELAELVRMAAWRLDHLQWREQVEQRVSSLFSTTTGRQVVAAPPAPAKTPPPQ